LTHPIVIRQSELPLDGIAREFVGEDHGGIGFTFLLVDAAPGMGPALHSHPYPEVIIVQEGEATATVGEDTLVVKAGDIVIINAVTPHKFVNSGNGPLRQVDIHASPRFITEWLEEKR
jgi:mannose-6-phosphate isomerase-like protein (cupin superfamily)